MAEDANDDVDTPGDDLRDVLGMPPRRAPAVLTPGQVIDDAYRIEEEIGAGGMGRVYRAHDLRLSRDVALKLHGFAIAPDDNTLRREATALARLTHPNVVTVYEVGMWNGHPWVAMAYVPGGTVRTWLQAKDRTAREILSLFIAAGRGLEAAHAAGLVHRDFKPDNVLVGDDGRICVADFGLARDAGGAESNVGDIVGSPTPSSSPSSPLAGQTKTGAVRGTPAYMAPEQRDGTRVDASADQFAFAVSLWETLTGQRPFGDSPVKIAPPPPGRMPRHVEVALRRALSVAPSNRWPSMTELLDQLSRDPIRTRFVIATSVLGVLALVGGGFVIARRTQDRPDPGIVACNTREELASVWNDEARKKVLAGYPGQVGTRVIASLDSWVEQWKKQRGEACYAAGKDPLLAKRTDACLDRARARLVAGLGALDTGLHPIDAITIATVLPPITNCADASLLPSLDALPTTATEAMRMNVVESLIAQSETWQMTIPDVKRGIPLALSAVSQAESLRWRPMLARAQLVYASALNNAGIDENLLERFEGAVKVAAEAHDDVLVAEIYLKMLYVVIRLEKSGEIDRLLSVAGSAIERANRPQYLVDTLAARRADLARLREDFVTAISLYQQAAVATEARYGESSELARSLTLLGQCYSKLRRTDEARAALQRAAAIIQKLYGDLHPNLGTILTSLGDIDLENGRYLDAVKSYRRSLAIKEGLTGPSHRALVPTLINLTNALTMQGDYREAIVVGTRVLEMIEKTFPPGHPRVALALNVVGSALQASKDYAGAEAMYKRAIGMFPADSKDPLLSDPLRNLALLYAKTNKLRGARPIVVRALAVTTALDPASVDTTRVRLVLARIDRDPKEFAASLETIRKLLGTDHPEVVAAMLEEQRLFGPTKPK